MSSDCLTVVSVPEDRYDDAIHHLKWNFFADEPLNNAVGLCAKGESQYELERHCLLTLKQGYSRMLVDKKGAVCTRALNRARRNTCMQMRALCISLSYFTFDIIPFIFLRIHFYFLTNNALKNSLYSYSHLIRHVSSLAIDFLFFSICFLCVYTSYVKDKYSGSSH